VMFGVVFLPHGVVAAPPAVPPVATDPATAVGFKPHRAIYNVRLIKTHSGSQVVNIGGQMMYEWQPVCEAWLSNHHFNIQYEYVDTAPMKIVSDFSTYETFDGKSFSFISQRRRDGELFEVLRGQGEMEPGKGGQALYTMPDPMKFKLSDRALFPMGHSLAVLENMRKGKKFFNAVTFDGSDQEGPVEVNTFIGKPVDPLLGVNVADVKVGKGGKAAIDKGLILSPARKVRMAFFPEHPPVEPDDPENPDTPAGLEGVSDYEMSLILHENGVISEMTVEYADFTLSQKLLALEPLESGCGDGKTRLNP